MRQRPGERRSSDKDLSKRSVQDTRLPAFLTGSSRRLQQLPPTSAFEMQLLSPSLTLQTDIFSSGINGALSRWSPVECRGASAVIPVGTVSGWKPGWPHVRTVGLAFPDAVQFLPIEHRTEEELEVVRVRKKRRVDSASNGNGQRPSTRLQPPDDALSLEDRLFYILQPPLETMLGGQELIMPFEPFPHQYQGIGWLFSQNSALLADEMGLGKTMQTITAVRLLLRGGRVRSILFVCPKPLIPNWQREFRMWAEELPVVTVEGDTNRRRIIWRMQNVPIRIVNYEVLVRDMEQLSSEEQPKFDLVVLDEAQRIKNRDSKTAEIVRGLSRQRSWALTGTPIENRPEEMASLFEFLEVVPPRATPDLRQLSQIADVYVLRRTKNITMKDMPPLLDREEYLELSPAQKYAYHTAEKEETKKANSEING